MAYNINNITGFSDLVSRASIHSEGLAGTMFLVMILMTVYIYGRINGAESAFVAAAFSTALLALLARMLEFINTQTMMLFIIILTVAFVIQQLNN